MTQLERVILRLDTDMKSLGVHWALVGGIAVSLRARPRTTFDVDVAVSVSGDGEAEAIVLQLTRLGWVIDRTLEQEATGRMAGVRLVPPTSLATSATVDLLFASSGIEDEVVGMAERLEAVRGMGTLPVARTGHLIALKVLAESPEREHDRDDAQELLLVASADERELARSALDRIERRGYHRDKDLQAALADLISLAERRARRRQA